MLWYATTGERHQLVWVDRRGNVTPISEDRAAFRQPRVSPDGRFITVAANDAETRRSDVWIYDVERGTKTRLTTEFHNLSPVWTPDGHSILVSAWTPAASGALSLLREFPVDRSGGSTVLLPSDVIRSRLPAGTNPYPSSWSPDGHTILFQADARDIWALTRGADRPVPVLSRGADDWGGQFSPDGGAIVYASNESGQAEIYAASWPNLSGKTTVSTDGGAAPRWSRDGHEVFYRRGNAMMVAGLEPIAGGGFRVAPPRQLFSGDFTGTARDQSFDVSRDGQRFVMVRSDERAALRQLTVVQNWDRELKQRVPTR
jgi:serine/threonine-protein kinase